MKTGVVLEISNGKATVMQNGGGFIAVPAEKHWQKGDVVTLKNRRVNLEPLYAVAACFLIVISLSVFGYNLYYDEVSLVSLDVNPSIELGLNSFDRVIGVKAFNEDGMQILNHVDIKNQSIDKAILLLLNGGLNGYITDNSYVTFTVSSTNSDMEAALLTLLQNTANSNILLHHQTAQLEYYAVDTAFVSDAHSHEVTAGKYLALLQLKEVQPDIVIEEYAHHSIGDIREQINNHNTEHGGGHNNSPIENSPTIPSSDDRHNENGQSEGKHNGSEHH